MAKSAPHKKARSTSKKTPAVKRVSAKKKVLKPDSFGLVNFSYQDIAYQIDLDKSKVYRRFIEVEKSKQNSIMTAFRTVRAGPVRPSL